MFCYLTLLAVLGLMLLVNLNKRAYLMFLSIKYSVCISVSGCASWLSDVQNKAKNTIKEYPCKEGEIAIVTGGARGIGLEVVRGLLKCGMHVVLAVRNTEAGERAVEDLKKENYTGMASVLELDVGSMKSVERFAVKFKAIHDRLHVLVNNAGIIYGPHRLTEDGIETQLAINYVGHFYLTHLLLAELIRAGTEDKAARVVNVASCAHYGIHMFFEDFNMEKCYHPVAAYARSKMAQILSTRYLNTMFEARGLPVRMYAAHPGIVATDMLYNTPENHHLLLVSKYFKTPAQGATSIIYTAIATELENQGGVYINNCRKGHTDNYSRNKDVQERLYQVTRKMLDFEEFGKINKRS